MSDEKHDGHGNPLGTEYSLRCDGSTKYHDYVTVESYEALKASLAGPKEREPTEWFKNVGFGDITDDYLPARDE